MSNRRGDQDRRRSQRKGVVHRADAPAEDRTVAGGSDWLYEIKSDGYRAIAFKTGGELHLRYRNDNDFTRSTDSSPSAGLKFCEVALRPPQRVVRSKGLRGDGRCSPRVCLADDPNDGVVVIHVEPSRPQRLGSPASAEGDAPSHLWMRLLGQ